MLHVVVVVVVVKGLWPYEFFSSAILYFLPIRLFKKEIHMVYNICVPSRLDMPTPGWQVSY